MGVKYSRIGYSQFFTFPEAVPPATPITKGLGTLSLSSPFFLCQLLEDPVLFAAAII